MNQISDSRFYNENTPNEVKERILLEHQVNQRIKEFGLEEMNLIRFTTYFLRRVLQMTDEQFSGWLYD